MSGLNFCPNCGHKLQPHFAVCPNCGTRLKRDEQPPTPHASPAPPQRPTPPPQPPPFSPAPRPTPPQPAPQPPPVATPPQPQYRQPYQWMDTGEAPKPVVPLSQTQAYQPPVAQPNFFQCPDCGRAVPRAAMACPNCGRRFSPAPQPQLSQPTQSLTSPVPNWVGILLIALLAATLVLYFC